MKLSEVPPEVRMQAARRCLRDAKDGDEASALITAATEPSETSYFVSEEAARFHLVRPNGSGNLRGPGRTGVCTVKGDS